MNNIIIKLEHTNEFQESHEGSKIRKMVSSISPSSFIKLLSIADNKVNPRSATPNRITRAIHETLQTSPELFWFKSKGILIATQKCEIFDRNRINISLGNHEFEGIMDGGHNTFAIALYMIDVLFEGSQKIRDWEGCKTFWKNNLAEIQKRFEENKEKFSFTIPVEIITPNDDLDALQEYYDYISEICSARNNNVQLSETAKGNQVGIYDYLKKTLPNSDEVIWKTGKSGTIRSESIISLATLPLIFLQHNILLPKDINNLNRVSIYSQKSKCVDYFNQILSHKDISHDIKGKHILTSERVKSALDLTYDLLVFFDKLFVSFPSMYNNVSPGFGRIKAVNKKKQIEVTPYRTNSEISVEDYPHGFFYPLFCGLIALMQFNPNTDRIEWKCNPNDIDLLDLDLTQYIGMIRLVSYDPQKIGKQSVYYTEADNVFTNYLLSKS